MISNDNDCANHDCDLDASYLLPLPSGYTEEDDNCDDKDVTSFIAMLITRPSKVK